MNFRFNSYYMKNLLSFPHDKGPYFQHLGISSVADQQCFDADPDPDPTFYCYADLDPDPDPNPDPNPDPILPYVLHFLRKFPSYTQLIRCLN